MLGLQQYRDEVQKEQHRENHNDREQNRQHAGHNAVLRFFWRQETHCFFPFPSLLARIFFTSSGLIWKMPFTNCSG